MESRTTSPRMATAAWQRKQQHSWRRLSRVHGKINEKKHGEGDNNPSRAGATGDAMVDTVESEGAYRGSSNIQSNISYIGEISDTESGEDDDLVLQGQKSVHGNKPTQGSEGYDQRRGFVRRDREGSVASSIDTMRSTPLGQRGKGRNKTVTQPPGILKEQNTQLFPPPRPIIRTLDTEPLDAIDAQKTVTKEAPSTKGSDQRWKSSRNSKRN